MGLSTATYKQRIAVWKKTKTCWSICQHILSSTRFSHQGYRRRNRFGCLKASAPCFSFAGAVVYGLIPKGVRIERKTFGNLPGSFSWRANPFRCFAYSPVVNDSDHCAGLYSMRSLKVHRSAGKQLFSRTLSHTSTLDFLCASLC